MANLCEIDVKIVGRKDDRDKFIDALCRKSTVKIGNGAEITTDIREETYSSAFSGYVKWSVLSALYFDAKDMREHPENWHHYDINNKNGPQQFITLDEASKEYNVDVEIFSEEPAMQFAEHILIKKGKVTIGKRTSYTETFLDKYKTKEEAENATGLQISDEEWNSNCVTRGGFEHDFNI